MKLSISFRKISGKNFPWSFAETLGLLSLLGAIAFSGFVSGADSAFATAFVLLSYAFLFYLVRVFYCRVANKDFPKLSAFLRGYVRRVGIFILAFAISVSAFAVYQNEVDPVRLAVHTLSNGEKTVRFRTMAHVASDSFYSGVRDELGRARKDGYVLFYEGVRPGTPENSKKFEEMVGFRIGKELYEVMARLYGLSPQDMADIVPSFDPRDRNVDVSVDDIVAYVESRSGSGTPSSGSGISSSGSASASGSYVPSSPSSSGSLQALGSGSVSASGETLSERQEDPTVAALRSYADSLNPRELEVLRYFNRAVMGFVMKNPHADALAVSGFSNPDAYPAILDERDRILAEAILASEEKRIYVTYGLLHFDGVFDLLQERDPRWKVSAPSEYLYPTRP